MDSNAKVTAHSLEAALEDETAYTVTRFDNFLNSANEELQANQGELYALQKQLAKEKKITEELEKARNN